MINKKVISLVLSLALIVSCFASVASLGVYAIDNTKKTTSLQTSPVVTTTTAEKKAARTVVDAYPTDYYPTQHCECGNIWKDNSGNTHYLWGEGNCKNDDNHGCNGEILEWTPITASTISDSAAHAAGGNYYLTGDVTVSTQMYIDANETVHYDLNGHKFIRDGGRFWGFNKKSNVTFTVTDTKGTGEMNVINYNSTQGMLFLMNGANGTFKFYGGSYTAKTRASGTYTFAAFAAAATESCPEDIYFFEDVVVDCSEATPLSTNTSAGGAIAMTIAGSNLGVYGATIIGPNRPNGSGGTMQLGSTKNGNVTATIKNSTITGGTGKNGGNIYIGGKSGAVSRLDISSSVISNGTASIGGNIYIDGYGQVYYDDTTITGGKANTNGGNVELANTGARFEQPDKINNVATKKSTISNGSAKNGGNILHASGNVVCRKTDILNGTATDKGGNIHSGANFTLTSCNVSGGTAASGTGNGQDIFIKKNVFAFYGTTSVAGEIYALCEEGTARTHTIAGTSTLSNYILGAPQAATTSTYHDITLNFSGFKGSMTLTVEEPSADALSFANQTFNSVEEAITRNIATNVTDDIAEEMITVTNEGYELVNDNGTGHLGIATPKHRHKLSVNAPSAPGTDDIIRFQGVSTEADFTAAIAAATTDDPANIYLEKDIQLTEATTYSNAYLIKILANQTINICLNGHKLIAHDSGADGEVSKLFEFSAGTSVLNICDCSNKQGALSSARETKNTKGNPGGLIYAGFGAKFNAYGVVFEKGGASNGGLLSVATSTVYLYDCDLNDTTDANNGIIACTAGTPNFNMLGGSITSNKVGAVYTTSGAGAGNMRFTDVDISNDVADTACIEVEKVNLYLTNCDVESVQDKALVINDTSTATITNSNITSAADVAASNATIHVDGALTMTGGSVTSTGGEYALLAKNDGTKDVVFNNVAFTTNTARIANIGDGSHHDGSVTLNNCSATITNSATKNGGLFYNYAILNINGGTYTGPDVESMATVLFNGHAQAEANIYGGAVINGGTAGANGGTIWNQGTVNVYGNSTITGGSGNNGGNIYNSSGSVLNVTDSTISNGKSTLNGGNIFAYGTVNITNSTITGGETTTTSGKAGNIAVSSPNTTVTLTDSTISNGSAQDNGGAMYINSNATTTIVNINGCTFTGNKVYGRSKFGGDMFVGAATVTIGASETNQTTFTGATSEYESGTTGYTVSDNSIATNSTGAHVTIKDATTVRNILPRQVGEEGILIQDTATVEKVYVEAAEFTVNDTTYDYVNKLMFDFSNNSATQTVAVSPWRASNIRIDRNDFAKAPSNVTFNLLATDYSLVNDGTFYDLIYVTQTRTQCVCGGKAANVGNHVCDSTVVFTEWYNPDSLPTSGNYYLTNNVNIDTKTTTGDLNLDLNGFDIKKTAAVVLFEVPAGKTLNLTDTEGTGSIDGDKIATASDGANILVKGTFNMFAGTIKDGYADGKKGGNVNVKANAVMNMYGGTIKDGNANKGGNIITDYTTTGPHGVLNMYAGSITGGTANEKGGNLYMYDTSVAYVNGTVTGGTAPEKSGPDIYVSYRYEEMANARTGAQLTLGADADVGTVDAIYPYTTVTVEDGAQVTTLNYNTLNATRTVVKKSAPTAEKQSGENPNSAFNNWYLLARGQKKTEDGLNWIRFTSLVDSDIDSYFAAGFYITIEGEETQNIEIHNVYKTNFESGVEKQIGDYSLAGDYYFHTDLSFTQDLIDAGKRVTIKPYLVDNEGNYYYGAEVSNTLSSIFN